MINESQITKTASLPEEENVESEALGATTLQRIVCLGKPAGIPVDGVIPAGELLPVTMTASNNWKGLSMFFLVFEGTHSFVNNFTNIGQIRPILGHLFARRRGWLTYHHTFVQIEGPQRRALEAIQAALDEDANL